MTEYLRKEKSPAATFPVDWLVKPAGTDWWRLLALAAEFQALQANRAGFAPHGRIVFDVLSV